MLFCLRQAAKTAMHEDLFRSERFVNRNAGRIVV